MPVCSLLLSILSLSLSLKPVRCDDLHESAGFIWGDLAANSYVLGLKDMI